MAPWSRSIVITVGVVVALIGFAGDVIDTSLLRGRLELAFWRSPNFTIWALWGLFVPILLAIETRRSLVLRLVALFTLIVFHFGFFTAINFAEMDRLARDDRFLEFLLARFPRVLAVDTAVYAIILALAYGMRSVAELRRRERDAARLQAEVLRTEVELVKSHVNSDQLLAALKEIREDIETNPRRAETRIEELSDFLEAVLAEINPRAVPGGEIATDVKPARIALWLMLAPLLFTMLTSAIPILIDTWSGTADPVRVFRTGLHAACLTLFVPLILLLAKPRIRSNAGRALHILGVLLIAMLLAIAGEILFITIVEASRGRPPLDAALQAWNNRRLGGSRLLFLCIGAAALAAGYARRQREREIEAELLKARLADAQLRALKMQLHPHFLFNTLNAIAGLLEHDPAAARLMTERLERFLSISLTLGDAQEVPLRDELRFVMTYLEIQRARFGERLRIALEADEAVLDVLVPPLILQPLVENAIRHGIAPKKSGGKVSVTAAPRGDMLQLTIEDDGAGMPSDSLAPGIGLSNTQARLQQLYGQHQKLTFRSLSGSGFSIELLLPLRFAHA